MQNNLKNALPLIASALAGKQGVKVLQGDWAKTNCVDTIWLPPLPDDDPKVRVKALGFVGHETGHIAWTDNKVTDLVRSQKNPSTFFGMMNLLEDVRMEKLQSTRFPGVADNLQKLFEVLVDEKIYFIPSDSAKPINIMQGWMINKLRYDLLNQKAFEPLITGTDEVFEKTLPLNTRIRLEALAYDVENAKSTMDVFNLTAAIMKMIEEEEENEKKQEEEEAKQQQQTQPDDSTQSSNQSQSSDSSDDSQDDGNPVNGSSQDGEDDGEAQSTGDAAGEDGDLTPKMSDILKSILGAGKDEQYQDIGDVLADQINSIKADSDKTSYDGSGPMRVFNAVKHANKGRNATYDFEARSAVNALKLKLHTMLQSQTFNDSTRSDKGSRFSQRHLHEVKIGGKVFEKRTEGIDIDVAATLLTDISGSMNDNNKLKIAALASYATAEALASVHGVVSAVAVFPTASGVDYLTTHGTKPATNAESFNQLSVYGDTPLSDAMARCSIDLLQQQKSRKMLIVVTDGEPNFDDQSEQVIKAAVNAGIEIMGVGIGVELDHLFDTWCSINSVSDLPKALFGMLQNKLTYKKAA
jgi:hypothetical protein